jgi:hypothetical protein
MLLSTLGIVAVPGSTMGLSLLDGSVPIEQLLRKTASISTREIKRTIEEKLLFKFGNHTELIRFGQP